MHYGDGTLPLRLMMNSRVIVVIWVLFAFSGYSHALNCGTQGSVYPIQEQNALEWILQRLKHMELNGEIEKHQQKLKTKALVSLERPNPISGLKPTQTPRVFTKDLTVTISQDIRNAKGALIHPAGTKINPLSNPLLASKKVLIFLDADDLKQLNFALHEYQKRQGFAKLVLVKGPVLELIRKHQIPFYFDQSGRLTRYFGFKQIPALVYQQNQQLVVAEVRVE